MTILRLAGKNRIPYMYVEQDQYRAPTARKPADQLHQSRKVPARVKTRSEPAGAQSIRWLPNLPDHTRL